MVNNLILHIYIIIIEHYNTYIILIHSFYIWFGLIINVKSFIFP